MEGRQHRTLGDVLWAQGSIGPACASYARNRDEALALDQHDEAALSQACLAFAAAFEDRARASEQIARADHMLAGANARFAELQVSNAHLLQDSGSAVDLPEQAEAVAALASENGLSSCVAYARLAACFHAAVQGTDDLIHTSRAKLRECVRGAEFAYLLELAHFMTDEEPPPDLPRAHWIDGAQETQRRWSRLVIDRRRELASFNGE
jgi:hypothetical protein